MSKEMIEVEHAVTVWLEGWRMVWVRLQIFTAIEVAVLGGWYVVCKDGYLGLARGLIVVGSVLLAWIAGLMWHDIRVSDGFRDVVKDKYLFPEFDLAQNTGRRITWAGVWFVALLNVILLFVGCSCFFGDYWACVL